MTQKSMGYDAAAYEVVLPIAVAPITGAAAISAKFVAFTNMIIKSVTVGSTVLGTAADIMNVVKVTGLAGTNTTTTTTAYGTNGSGSYFNNFTPASAANQVTLQQGDLWWLQKGADTAGTYAATVEVVLQPFAPVTV